MNTAVSVASLASAAAVAAPSIAAPAAGECSFPELAASLDDALERFRAQFLDDLARDRSPENEPHPDPELTSWARINDAVFSIGSEIVKQPARTLADIAVQARAAALMNSELWLQAGNGLYNGDRDLRRLVESITALAGQDVLPGLPVLPEEDVDGEQDDDARTAEPPNMADDPVFAAIKRHTKAEAALAMTVTEKGDIDAASQFGKAHTAETKRQSRNVDRRLARAQDRERAAWRELLSTVPGNDFAKAHFVGYVHLQIDRCGGQLDADDMRLFMQTTQAMVTPPWVSRWAEVRSEQLTGEGAPQSVADCLAGA